MRDDDDELDHQQRERVATRAGKDEARKRPRRWVAEDPGARDLKLAFFIYIRVSGGRNFKFFFFTFGSISFLPERWQTEEYSADVQ